MSKHIVLTTPEGQREIGPGKPIFIIAEMSGNHGHNIKKAYKLIDVAAEAGVDAIKLQTYTPDTITLDSDKEDFQVKVNDAWSGQTLYKLYEQAYTPWEWQPKLKAYAEKKGLLLFSSPFDETAVDFLEEMGVAIYKVASFEITHIPLLKKIAATKKPVIISRGMSTVEDITLAINTLKEHGCPQVAVLHCVSSYPALPEEMNLKTITDIGERFNVIPGLSDHTLGITVPITSVALGACIIEKHFTLSRAEGGPDANFSLEPAELKELVSAVREAEKAIGEIHYEAGDKESENKVFRRSIYTVKDIKKGEQFTKENVKVIRPGFGLEPKCYEDTLGKNAAKDIERATAIKKEHLEQ